MYSILRIYESCILSAILICQHCIEIILPVYVYISYLFLAFIPKFNKSINSVNNINS